VGGAWQPSGTAVTTTSGPLAGIRVVNPTELLWFPSGTRSPSLDFVRYMFLATIWNDDDYAILDETKVGRIYTPRFTAR
jgi:hypothetical protein